jgi:polysaccharide export outer membrane protein
MRYLFLALFSLLTAVTSAHAQSDYRLQPGDSVSVEVLEDPSLNRTLLVLPNGSVNFPFVGSIQAGGRTVEQVRQQIASGISSNFAAPPTVFASVASVRPDEYAPGTVATGPTIDVFLTGEINSPGLKQVPAGTTFLQALAVSGGFTNFAALKRVQLRRTDSRGQPQVYTINYRAISDGARLSRALVLRDGDVILVPERRLFE